MDVDIGDVAGGIKEGEKKGLGLGELVGGGEGEEGGGGEGRQCISDLVLLGGDGVFVRREIQIGEGILIEDRVEELEFLEGADDAALGLGGGGVVDGEEFAVGAGGEGDGVTGLDVEGGEVVGRQEFGFRIYIC